jgi:CHASE2 domain
VVTLQQGESGLDKPLRRLVRWASRALRGLGRALLWCVPKAYQRHIKKHWPHHFVVSLLMASLVLLTQAAWYGVEDYLALKAHELSLAVPSGPHAARSQIAIIKIDKARHTNPETYAGRSPLDRCQLTRDLDRVLRVEGVKTVAIDLDLSPTERASFASASASSASYADRHDRVGQPETLEQTRVELECQRRLDALLTDKKNATRLLVMLPSASHHSATNEQITQWQQSMRAAGVQLGSVELNLTRGVLRTYKPDFDPRQPTFSEALRHRLAAQADPASSALPLAPVAQEFGGYPIAFGVLRDLFKGGSSTGDDIGFDHECLLPRLKSCGFHTVVIGAGYSTDDEHLTPIGALNGVDVHTALAVCPAKTKSQVSKDHLLVLAMEVALGVFVLAPMMGFFWGRYFQTRWGQSAGSPHRVATPGSAAARTALGTAGSSQLKLTTFLHVITPAQPGSAYMWLVFMVALLLLFLSLFALLPMSLFAWLPVSLFAWLPSGLFAWLAQLWPDNCSVKPIPTALVIGLLLEAGMVQGGSHASQAGAASHHHHHRTRWPFEYRLRSLHTAILPTLLRWLAYDAVLLWAMYELIWQH